MTLLKAESGSCIAADAMVLYIFELAGMPCSASKRPTLRLDRIRPTSKSQGAVVAVERAVSSDSCGAVRGEGRREVHILETSSLVSDLSVG